MNGNGIGRLQPLPFARYVITDVLDVIPCVERWLAEEQQARFRRIRKSRHLIV